ncbi:MAG: hypothetical protein AAF936_09485 [Pseudomonadota bacterium]
MRLSLLLCLAIAAACGAPQTPEAEYRLNNGQWYQNGAFTDQTVYIVGGALRFSDRNEYRLAEDGKTIDLKNRFVVPAYCEAHNHNLGDGVEGVDETVKNYLEDGVFYVMIQGSFQLYREKIADQLNTPDSVDVAFANNGLTGSGGHPRRLRESLMERFERYPDFTKETLPDKGYFEADSLPQLREKWALILTERPDFVKVMLYHSEEYELRKDNPDYYGRRGLNPALLPEFIRMAHGENLRASVHVETDFDMATALSAGADIIAHVVSNDSNTRISDETIALAKTSGASIITTISVGKRIAQRAPDEYAKIVEAQKDNLRRLNEAGVKLAIGSDTVFDTSRSEADLLASLGVLDNPTLIEMWTSACAETVFPQRKIGRLDDGYEASFLILSANPLEDFENTNAIQLRFKDGKPLEQFQLKE